MLSSAIPGPVEENLSNPKRCTKVLALATYGLGRRPWVWCREEALGQNRLDSDLGRAMQGFLPMARPCKPPEKQHAQIHQPEPVQQQTEFQEGIEVAQS